MAIPGLGPIDAAPRHLERENVGVHTAFFMLISKALWLVTVGGAVVGLFLYLSAYAAEAAPGQAAAAAMACASAILPYVVARAWDELTGRR